MELDPRKSRILTCVVESYIRTGEPIGSKMIAAMLEETVSSATVRNDLAYLSEQGYIEQPHTSAGRIPTHRGLRYYLDHLMKPQPLEDAARGEIDALFNYGPHRRYPAAVQQWHGEKQGLPGQFQSDPQCGGLLPELRQWPPGRAQPQ